MDKEKLQRGLGLFLDAMRPYVVSVVERECRDGVSWDMDFEHKITNDQKRTNWQMNRMKLVNNGSSLMGLIDYNNLVTFIINYKDSVTREVGGNNKDYNRLRSGIVKKVCGMWVLEQESLMLVSIITNVSRS